MYCLKLVWPSTTLACLCYYHSTQKTMHCHNIIKKLELFLFFSYFLGFLCCCHRYNTPRSYISLTLQSVGWIRVFKWIKEETHNSNDNFYFTFAEILLCMPTSFLFSIPSYYRWIEILCNTEMRYILHKLNVSNTIIAMNFMNLGQFVSLKFNKEKKNCTSFIIMRFQFT